MYIYIYIYVYIYIYIYVYVCVCVCVLKDIRPQNLHSSPLTPEQVVASTAPGAALRPLHQVLITGFIEEDSPFCLIREIARTMIPPP